MPLRYCIVSSSMYVFVIAYARMYVYDCGCAIKYDFNMIGYIHMYYCVILICQFDSFGVFCDTTEKMIVIALRHTHKYTHTNHPENH